MCLGSMAEMPAKLDIFHKKMVLTKQAWKDFKDNSCFTGLKQGSLQVSELVEVEECGQGCPEKAVELSCKVIKL